MPTRCASRVARSGETMKACAGDEDRELDEERAAVLAAQRRPVERDETEDEREEREGGDGHFESPNKYWSMRSRRMIAAPELFWPRASDSRV